MAVKKVKKRKKTLGARGFSSGASREMSPLRPRHVEENPPCHATCPSGNRIRQFVTTIAQAERLEKALTEHNAMSAASSTAIRRAILAPRPPDRSAGEINDKGHLVQRRTLANLQPLVARLYADNPQECIIVSQEEPL